MRKLLPSIKSDETLAIAVSGGGDSMALAWLLRRYHSKLLAIIVDHQLRVRSAYEARETARKLENMGIEVQCITLTGLATDKAVEEQARLMRYDVLFKHCREAKCRYLFVAHQTDDQIETVYKRLSFKSGVDGRAGMAWCAQKRGLMIVRPLLGVSRQALRETLKKNQVQWFDDETNEQTERGQIRQSLRSVVQKERLWEDAARCGLRRMKRDEQARAWFSQNACFYPQGWVALGNVLPLAFMLSRLLQAYGDNPYPPSDASLAKLIANPKPCTLRGMRLIWWRSQWFCVREYGSAGASVEAVTGACWDKRYRLEGFTAKESNYYVGATGLGLKRGERHHWPAAFCATLPCLYQGGKRLAIPYLGYFAQEKWQSIHFVYQPPRPFLPKSLYGASCRNVRQYFLP